MASDTQESVQDGEIGSGDWAGLPPELLRRVLAAALPPPERPEPLLRVARLWLALRLTCRSWAIALEGAPLAVEVCIPLPWVLPWMRRHVSALRLVPPPALFHHRGGGGSEGSSSRRSGFCDGSSAGGAVCGRQEPLSWVQERCGQLSLEGDVYPCADTDSPHVAAKIAFEEYIQRLATCGGRAGAFSFQSALFVPPGKLAAGPSLVLCHAVWPAGTPFDYDGSYQAQPMLELADLRQLQVLDITCGFQGPGTYGWHTFDTAPLEGLPALHTLVLRGFEEPCLWGLPRSLRMLRLLGGAHNDTSHNPVRFPRHFFALPNYCCLDKVEVLGYNQQHRTSEFAAPNAARLSPANAVEAFHSKRRFKLLLTNQCRQSARVRTDAELLHLGPPDPVLTTKRWLAPDHGLQVHLSTELAAALEALAGAVIGQRQRQWLARLEISAQAFFVLPTGALVPAALLAGLEGRQAVEDYLPGGQVEQIRLQCEGSACTDWLQLTWTWPQR